MKLSDLNKEQKQKLVLFVMVGLGAIYALVRFAVLPLLDGRSERGAQLDRLKGQYEQAMTDFRGEAKLEEQVQTMRTALEADFKERIPPTDNALSWASAFIYSRARPLGLDVSSVAEVDSGSLPWSQPDQAKRIFKPYAVRVSFVAGFHELKRFMTSLQQGNTYVAITSLSIQTDPREPARQAVSLVLEWPAWKEAARSRSPFGQPVVAVETNKP